MVAALAVSIVALMVAVGSAWFTRRQAAATEHLRDQGQIRAHREATPALEVVIGTRYSNRVPLNITNHGPADLDGLKVKFPGVARSDGAAVGFDIGEGPYTPSVDLGPLPLGGVRGLELVMSSPSEGGPTNLIIEASAGGDVWRVTKRVEVDVPPQVW